MTQRQAALAFAILCSIATSGFAAQQPPPAPTRPSPAAGATLVVRLIDPVQKAEKRAATVECTVTGLQVVDPATVNEQPRPGQGHLHYQVDGGMIIATTAMKLSFHELKPGEHVISVTLAANDHAALGPPQTVRVQVPGASASAR